MRILATHNAKDVVIIAILYEGENLKAVYIDSEGEIDADAAGKFTVKTDAITATTFVDAIKKLKVKAW